MEKIGIDVHKVASQLCTRTDGGAFVEQRIATRRAAFTKHLGGRARARVLLEASTESEWVARCLEAFGHEVIVADPSFAPMYATRSRKIKTDRRDARALCEACELGAYRAAHRSSDAARGRRAQIAVRAALIDSRTKYISLARALVRQEGYRVGTARGRGRARVVHGTGHRARHRDHVRGRRGTCPGFSREKPDICICMGATSG